MNYQKDIKKDTENKRTDSNVFETNPLNYKSFFGFASKKTEKLVMALYMVTDGVDMDEALGKKIRLLSVELMSGIHNLSVIYKSKKTLSIISIQSKIDEMFSFIEVAQTIGFISEMNSSILAKELSVLLGELIRFEKEIHGHSTVINQDYKTTTERFVIDSHSLFVETPAYQQLPSIKDFPREEIYKRHLKDNNSKTVFYKKERPLQINRDKASREDRRLKIKDFLKDKGFVSIKDISLEITDCSEKTLQRELNELVSQGQVIKEGEKRWSRYKLKNTI